MAYPKVLSDCAVVLLPPKTEIGSEISFTYGAKNPLSGSITNKTITATPVSDEFINLLASHKAVYMASSSNGATTTYTPTAYGVVTMHPATDTEAIVGKYLEADAKAISIGSAYYISEKLVFGNNESGEQPS